MLQFIINFLWHWKWTWLTSKSSNSVIVVLFYFHRVERNVFLQVVVSFCFLFQSTGKLRFLLANNFISPSWTWVRGWCAIISIIIAWTTVFPTALIPRYCAKLTNYKNVKHRNSPIRTDSRYNSIKFIFFYLRNLLLLTN